MLEIGKPMDTTSVENLIAQEYRAGMEYVYGPDNIAAERDRNYDYRRGVMLDLPAAAGRSKVIAYTVADYIGLLMPNLMRIFTSGRNIGEYVSPKKDLQPIVKVITRYINDVVIRKDNRGELMLQDWADDALVQKLGTVMWVWEDKKEAQDQVLNNLTPELMLEVGVRAMQGEFEIVEHTAAGMMVKDDRGDEIVAETDSVKIRRWVNKSKCAVDVILPEEFIISRDARTTEDAVYKAHRTGIAVGDCLAFGWDPEVIKNLPAYVDPYPNRTQKYNQSYINDPSRQQSADPMLKKVGIMRGILRCDYDGTGVKQWFVVAGGDTNQVKLLSIEPYNWQIGFPCFTPEPLPHTIYGRCPADRLAMLQKIQTVLVRQMNDNLFLSNTPQREVVMANIIKPDQLMNFAPGNPILVTAPNSIREIAVPFVADKALMAMQYYDAQAEMTTGVGRNTAGLDPEALTNQSATAANNIQSNMMGRVEQYARVWAQGGMRELFRGVFNCIRNYQDFERVVQIEGEAITIDPRQWADLEDLDVNINTGLGSGNRERDAGMLSAVRQMQIEALKTTGPSPMVDYQKLSRTTQMLLESMGISYPELLWGDATTPDGQPWNFTPPEPKPSPDTLVNAQALTAAEEIKGKWSHANKQLDVASNERIQYRNQDINAVLKSNEIGVDTAKVMVEASKVEVDAEKVRKAVRGDSSV